MLSRIVPAAAVLLTASLSTGARTSASSAAVFARHTGTSSASGVSKKPPSFKAPIGAYSLSFQAGKGTISITSPRSKAAIQIRELGGNKKLDLLNNAKKVKHSGNSWTITGKASWASFSLEVKSLPVPEQATSGTAFLGFLLTINPSKAAPGFPSPEMRIANVPAGSLKVYADAPPIAGNNLFLSDKDLSSSMLYYADYTALGTYFDRTKSGVTQSSFSYPGAGSKGSLVGAQGNSFGYVPPDSSLNDLPRHKSTTVLSSYLYLSPGMPSTESKASDNYLQMLDAVTSSLPKPSIPMADWPSFAGKEVQDLTDPQNWVTVNGHQYLRSYVSDTRSAPELITQAGVLAGIEAYEARFHVVVPYAATLDEALLTFYDPVYQTAMNGLPHDPQARGESWYFVDNLISLLQLSQDGDKTAKQLLLESVGTLMKLAHVNNYEFPQSFAYSDLNGGSSSLQADVAGGYAWLMLGAYDLTGSNQYLEEAKTSIAHVVGKGFNLAYETHMSAYSAAAAERLYSMTGDATYQGYAELALANLFHSTRFWDCTYGSCRKGSGYHTFMGLNPLPWSDYIAMLEQYEAWVGLRSYAKYAAAEPPYVADLVNAFLTYTPQTLQYALPPLLPPGAASSAAGEYSFVPRNNLSWYIPLEDLREGESTSGVIGQELYGAGGPFFFAADS